MSPVDPTERHSGLVRSIVFFGLDGRFSTQLLQALARSDLSPLLVVRGEPEPKTLRGPFVRALPARTPPLKKLFGRKSKGERGAYDLVKAAHGLGIDVLETSDPGTPQVRAQIQKLLPEAFVVAGFHRLLPRSVLELARLGGLNVHPGALPEERGPAPLFWALKEGRTRLFFSIHVLDEGEDTGDVVRRGELRFTPGLDGQTILGKCAEAAAPHLIAALRDLLAGQIVRTPQRRGVHTRKPRPEFRDGRIDPGRTAEEVFTFVAGCASAYPLFAECGGDRFFIKGALSYELEGRMVAEYVLTGEKMLLRCTPGIVELELKADGALFSSEYRDSASEG